MATGVCKICGHSFSSSDVNETVCPRCRYEKSWDRLLTVDTPSVSSFEQPTELTINTQKIVLENGGIQLVVDNDTIKAVNSIEVNGIKFARVKE